MSIHHLSDQALLATLVGSRAAARLLRKTEGRLAPVLNEVRVAYGVDPVSQRLGAAWELVRRALEERLHAGDCLSAPATVRAYLKTRLGGLGHEVFLGLFVDAQNRLIAAEELFRGTLTQTSVYPREVVKRALHHNAGGAVFAHNHPSGLAHPSRADELLTQSLQSALALVDVKVLDHFIVAGDAMVSFAEIGRI